MLYEIGIFMFAVFWLLCGRVSYKISLWESKRNTSLLGPSNIKYQWDIEDKFIATMSFLFGTVSYISYWIDGTIDRYYLDVYGE